MSGALKINVVYPFGSPQEGLGFDAINWYAVHFHFTVISGCTDLSGKDSNPKDSLEMFW